MKSCDILFLSTNDFDGLPTRKQRFAKHFANNGFRVFFVEAPYTYLGVLKDKKLKEEKYKKAKKGLYKHENLEIYIVSPPPWLPFFKKSVLISKINSLIYYIFLTKMFKKINFSPQLIWTYLPFIPYFLKKFDSAIKIYDCVDDHSSYPGQINPQIVNILERETSLISDVVIVTNDLLYKKIENFGKTPYKISNGVDHALFSKPLNDFINERKPLKNSKKIGYVGAIASWLDKDLLIKISNEFKDYEIHLIGPVFDFDTQAVANHKNIKIFPPIEQSKVPEIIFNFDVAIIPFKKNSLTKMVDPLKFYEYMACGVPVVSVYMDSLKNFLQVASLANTHEDFLKSIKKEIGNDSIEKKVERSKLVLPYSFEEKYKEIDRIIKSVGGEKWKI